VTEAVVIAALVVFPLVGAVTRRWQAVLLPTVWWPLFYAGLNKGWWGDGTGDGWQWAAVAIGAFSFFTTAAAVALARGGWPPAGRSTRSTESY
jgi:hypothetical protein